MSTLIFLEFVAIIVHLKLFKNKKKAIKKNLDLTQQIRDDLTKYLATKEDIKKEHDEIESIKAIVEKVLVMEQEILRLEKLRLEDKEHEKINKKAV